LSGGGQVTSGGSCQIVWPCDAIASTSFRDTPASASVAIAAAASHSPNSKFRRQYSRAEPVVSADASRARCAAEYGIER